MCLTHFFGIRALSWKACPEKAELSRFHASLDLIVLAALAQPGLLQSQSPVQVRQRRTKPLEIGLTCTSWGVEVPRVHGKGFDLADHTIRVEVDGAVTATASKLRAVLEKKAQALPRTKPRQAVVGCSMAVTCGDITRVAEIARDAGFDDLRLELTTGTRAAGGQPKPKLSGGRAPIQLVLVRHKQLIPGLVPPESIAKTKTKPQPFDARLALDFDQSGSVKHDGKLVYRWTPGKAADTSKLVATVRAMAEATAGARNAGEPTLIFVRADRCTEVFLVRKVLAICADAARGFDGFGLVATRPREKKR